MVLGDLVTAARYGFPITVIVFNNGTLQMEQDKMMLQHLRPFETDITNPNFVQIAESSGWTGRQAQTLGELRIALQAAKSSAKPCLIDVHVRSDIKPPSTGTWQLPPLRHREPVFGSRVLL